MSKLLGLSLMIALPAAANAAIEPAPSPALAQLQQIEGAQDAGGRAETAASKGSLGFTVQTLAPVGYVNADGTQGDRTQQTVGEDPAPKQPTTGSGHYVFEGKTPLKGVTIYTPKDDPNGTGSTEKPKAKGPVSNKMVYGALGLGAAATIGGLWFPPLLFLGGLLLGAGAVLFFINKKFAK